MLLFRQELNTVTSAAVIVIRGQIHHRQARQQPSLLPYDPSLCYISTTRTAPNSPKPLHITLICPCTLHACCLPHAAVACALRRNCGLPPATATITNYQFRLSPSPAPHTSTMSVELDPPELGFKREHRQHAFLCTHTERGRPLPARGVADPPSQEPSLRPGRIQGKQVPARCCAV